MSFNTCNVAVSSKTKNKKTSIFVTKKMIRSWQFIQNINCNVNYHVSFRLLIALKNDSNLNPHSVRKFPEHVSKTCSEAVTKRRNVSQSVLELLCMKTAHYEPGHAKPKNLSYSYMSSELNINGAQYRYLASIRSIQNRCIFDRPDR